jgi:hypothetical protein
LFSNKGKKGPNRAKWTKWAKRGSKGPHMVQIGK